MNLQIAQNNLQLALANIDLAILHTDRIKELADESIVMTCDPSVSPTMARLTVELNQEKIKECRERKNDAVRKYADCVRELFEQGNRSNAFSIGNLIVEKDGTVKAN